MERVLVTLSNRLVKKEYDVTILLTDTEDSMKDELDPAVSLIKKPYKEHFGRKLPYLRHRLYDDGMWETRAKPEQLYRYYIGNKTYDAEIAFFRGLCVKIVSGSMNRNAVHLAWVHNDFRKARGYQNNFSDMKQVSEAYRRLDRVVCVSKEAKTGFCEVIGDTGNLEVVYNMLDVERIRTLAETAEGRLIPPARLRLAVVARLEDKAKGQLRLIRTVSKLRGEGESISLTVVGGGEDEKTLRQEILQNDAQEYITMTGSLRNPYPYIKEADLLVCSSYYEGYNLTVAEALILGTPVISTDCTGPGEILDGGRYGMIVENSEEGLYRGLKAFCSDPDLLETYRNKAKERQDFFSEERIFQQIETILERKENG